MLQSTYKKQRAIDAVEAVKPAPQKTPLSAQEAVGIPASELSLYQQKKVRKRAEDLSWQIKFANMKLQERKNEGNLEWDPLNSLLEIAQAKYRGLGSV